MKNNKQIFLLNFKVTLLTIIVKFVYDIFSGQGPDGQALLFIFIPIIYMVALQFISTSVILYVLILFYKRLFFSDLFLVGVAIICGLNLLVENLLTWYLNFEFNLGSSIIILIGYLFILVIYRNKHLNK